MNSENEIKHRLLDVCKVKGWDSDINIVGFHALCDELKALGADDEREACAKAAGWLWQQFQDTKDAHERNTMESFNPDQFGFNLFAVQQSQQMMDAIRARGHT